VSDGWREVVHANLVMVEFKGEMGDSVRERGKTSPA
jgi:hypothetical protein